MKFLLKVYTFLFCRKIFYHFHKFIFQLSLKGLGVQNSLSIYFSGEIKSLLRLSLPSNAIMIDCGARIGIYAVYLRKYFPDAKIICFEPNPLPLRILNEKAQRFNFSVQAFALSSENNDHKKMYEISGYDFGTSFCSLFKENVQDSSKKNGESLRNVFEFTVQTQTLDHFMEINGILQIDLLKIDCEGSEWEILNGARKALSQKKIKYIQFEFDHSYIQKGITLEKFINLLSDFELFRILADGQLISLHSMLKVERDLYDYQNILCCPRI